MMAAFVLMGFMSCNNSKENKEHDSTQPAADTSHSTAAAPAGETPQAMPDSAAMAKAWEAYMTPGDMHKLMASMDGKWDAEMTFWMTPDAPPTTHKSTSEVKTILGGRYQETVYKGKMDGMDFEGHGTMGYDNAKKKFISTWIDNMGTGMMISEGTYDEASKSISMSGKSMDPSMGKELETRSVHKMVDDKHHVMEMFCTVDGKEFKNMEIKLSKK